MEAHDIAGRASVGTATILAEIFLLEFSNQEMPKVSYLKASDVFVVGSFAFISLALMESAIVYKVSSVSLKRRLTNGKGEMNMVRTLYNRQKFSRLIKPLLFLP